MSPVTVRHLKFTDGGGESVLTAAAASFDRALFDFLNHSI
jgi:hypothetical protein